MRLRITHSTVKVITLVLLTFGLANIFLSVCKVHDVNVVATGDALIRAYKKRHALQHKHSFAADLDRSVRELVQWEKYEMPHRRGDRLDLFSIDRAKQRNLVRFTTCDNCFEHNFKIILNNANICATGYERYGDIDLLIFITTAHAQKDRRDAIRRTWLEPSRNNTSNVRYVFLLGMTSHKDNMASVRKEGEVYGDIVIENFIDSYANLTYKTIMGFRWAVQFCAEAKFVLKTDDDVFVDVGNVLKLTEENKNELESGIAGSCSVWRRPIRETDSKWYVSNAEYPWPYLPPHCSGTGYITAMDVIKKVYNVSANVPFFWLEDVYVGLCLLQLHLTVYDKKGFNRIMHQCVYKESSEITMHYMTPERLNKVWTDGYVCINKTESGVGRGSRRRYLDSEEKRRVFLNL